MLGLDKYTLTYIVLEETKSELRLDAAKGDIKYEETE